MRLTTCRHCRQEIGWCQTINGKAMPIDPVANPAGNVYCEYQAGVLIGKVWVKSETSGPPSGVAHMPHFASCPVLNRRKGTSATPKPPTPPRPVAPVQPDLFQGES